MTYRKLGAREMSWNGKPPSQFYTVLQIKVTLTINSLMGLRDTMRFEVIYSNCMRKRTMGDS